MEQTLITGSLLHDLLRCDHRVALDLHSESWGIGKAELNDHPLWTGPLHVHEHIIQGLIAENPGSVDLRPVEAGSRQARTLLAMDARAPVIVGGEIAADDLLGQPILLLQEDDGYVPGEVSRNGTVAVEPGPFEGVTLALHCDILERNDLLAWPGGYVVGEQTIRRVDLHSTIAGDGTTLLDGYEDALENVRDIIDDVVVTRSAQAPECWMCHWRGLCGPDVERRDDLTQLETVDRATRDSLVGTFPTVASLAAAEIEGFVRGTATDFLGISAERLREVHGLAVRFVESNPRIVGGRDALQRMPQGP
ncbi:hypothetical protein [Sphingobium yanoikuyae]|uniref:hypothetical protein n=1 Tax=Sphingobium yanoikuyae TaxID=13690 RepID=UPI0028A5CEA1|nr:hypothetical protein [Sphingobium yanoikuyae]